MFTKDFRYQDNFDYYLYSEPVSKFPIIFSLNYGDSVHLTERGMQGQFARIYRLNNQNQQLEYLKAQYRMLYDQPFLKTIKMNTSKLIYE